MTIIRDIRGKDGHTQANRSYIPVGTEDTVITGFRERGISTMKAILVDDEILALRYLEQQLTVIGGVEIVGKYLSAEDGLKAAFSSPPDVVFFDIDMPELSGIEAAGKLTDRLPGTDVVFVTAYEDYAVKAFELNAVDYVLKPVEKQRLERTVARLIERRKAKAKAVASRPVMLRCFQTLELEFDKPEPIPWRTTKAQELFAYLIHNRHQPVRKDVLLELLWPEIDVKKGYTQLYTAIYQLRKTMSALGVDITIASYEKGYRLGLNSVKLDIEVWEKGVMNAKEVGPDTLDTHYALLDLYRGDYFAEYDYLWAESEKQRLRAIWFEHAKAVADYLNRSGRHAETFALYYRMLNIYPQSEDVYFWLMKKYAEQGDWASVDRKYAELTDMLRTEFGDDVSEPVREWYISCKTMRKKS